MGGNLTIAAPDNRDVLDTVSDGLRLFEVAANIAVSVVGIVGNAMTILAVVFCRKLHAVPNIYVANLAVVDLLVTAIICPVNAYSYLAGTAEIHCEALGAVTLLLLVLSVYTLGAVAVNRYILICRSRELYLRAYRRRNVALSVAALWLLSLAIVSPPWFGLGRFGYHVKLRGCFFPAYDFRSYAYGVSFLSLGTLLPNFTFTLFAYTQIIRRFRRAQKVFLKTHSRCLTSPVSSSVSSADAKSPVSWRSETECPNDAEAPITNQATVASTNTHTTIGRDLKVTLNLLVVFIVFLACWLPVAGVFVVDYSGTLPASVYSIFMILAYSNSALNVFLYAGMNPTYRRAYKNILMCKWKALVSSM